jgi:hypothetical protein
MLVTFAQYCVEFYLNLPKNDPDRFFRTHNFPQMQTQC